MKLKKYHFYFLHNEKNLIDPGNPDHSTQPVTWDITGLTFGPGFKSMIKNISTKYEMKIQ
jgi:hypothetical protein